MKTHPALDALAKKGSTAAGAPVVEGYLELDGQRSVRVHSSLAGGLVWEVEQSDVIHEAELPDTDGKTRLYIAPDAIVKASFSATMLRDDASGTYCGGSGTMYCWRRIRTADGTYIIILEPCGSCIPAAEAAGSAEVFRVT